MFAPADPDYPETVITALNVSLTGSPSPTGGAATASGLLVLPTAPISVLFRHAQDVAAFS